MFEVSEGIVPAKSAVVYDHTRIPAAPQAAATKAWLGTGRGIALRRKLSSKCLCQMRGSAC